MRDDILSTLDNGYLQVYGMYLSHILTDAECIETVKKTGSPRKISGAPEASVLTIALENKGVMRPYWRWDSERHDGWHEGISQYCDPSDCVILNHLDWNVFIGKD